MVNPRLRAAREVTSRLILYQNPLANKIQERLENGRISDDSENLLEQSRSTFTEVDTTKPTALFKSLGKGRLSTLSIAIPSSILNM